MPRDPIKGFLQKYFAQFGLTPAAADATAVARKFPSRPAMKAAPPAGLPSAPERAINPVINAYEGIDRFLRQHAHGYSASDAVKDIYSQSGAKDVVHGLRDNDAGQFLGGLAAALPAMLPAESKVARALLPQRWAVFTAENPGGVTEDAVKNAAHMVEAKQFLEDMGIQHVPVHGGYHDETSGQVLRENGFLLPGVRPEVAEFLGRRFNQNSIVTHRGLHDLVNNTLIPSKEVVAATEDSPAFTILPNGKGFAHDLDWEHPIPLSQLPHEGVAKAPVPKTQAEEKPTFKPDSTVAHSPIAKALLEKSPYAWEYGMLLPDAEATKVRSPMTPTEMANLVAYHSERTAPPLIPAQQDLPRAVPTRISAQKLQDVEDLAHKAFTGPTFLKWLQEGGKLPWMPMWYDTRQLTQDAMDAEGPDAGREAANELLNFTAGTTARSKVPENIRSGAYYRALAHAGELDPAAMREHALSGHLQFGHMAQATHQQSVANLLENGGFDPRTSPKSASFGGRTALATGNLGLNFRPMTIDTWIANMLGQAEPGLLDLGALKREGKNLTPNTNYYGALERGGQRAALDAANRGLIDVPAPFDPTAIFQAQAWGGGNPKAAAGGSFYDIFDKLRSQSANLWNVSPGVANSLIWRGHPLMLPLDAPLLKP